jgi:hypothetical protein
VYSHGEKMIKNMLAKNGLKQSERFIEAARKAGCSEDESVFDVNLKQIARHKPPLTPAQAPPRKRDQNSFYLRHSNPEMLFKFIHNLFFGPSKIF